MNCLFCHKPALRIDIKDYLCTKCDIELFISGDSNELYTYSKATYHQGDRYLGHWYPNTHEGAYFVLFDEHYNPIFELSSPAEHITPFNLHQKLLTLLVFS